MYNKNVCSQKEYLDGKATEDAIKPIIEKQLECILNDTSKYSIFDFVGDNIFVEVKGRKISSRKYNTTFINYKKIEKSNTLKDCDIYFFFKYTDCIKYIKYNNKFFDKFEIKETYLKHRNCFLKNCLIPVNRLLDIDK